MAAITSAANSLENSTSTLLVLGHNPGWEGAVADLGGRWVRMTTANAALLESDGEHWPEAMGGNWVLVDVLRPKEL